MYVTEKGTKKCIHSTDHCNVFHRKLLAELREMTAILEVEGGEDSPEDGGPSTSGGAAKGIIPDK